MRISPLPLSSGPEQYAGQAGDLFAAFAAGDAEAIRFLRDNHPRFCQVPEKELKNTALTPEDVRLALLRFYYFETWEDLAAWAEEIIKVNSPVAQFEAAAEAIIAGDTGTLASLLAKNPALVRMRSLRGHHSMLLHYTAANGVEGYRQVTPSNIVEIVKILVKAGAEVNAPADMYGGGSTTLGLAATSVWPVRAGVMDSLLEALLNAGALIDAPAAAGNRQLAVNGCLHNGRPEAADFLMRRGARLDLEAAAGTGRLDIVETFFNEDGNLKATATPKQMEYGFIWACAYGHIAVVEFFLHAGMDPGVQVDGFYGLHWALMGAHLDVIRLLIDRGAPLEERNMYGGTALGAALWAVANSGEVNHRPGSETGYIPVIETLLRAGSVIEPGTLEWIAREEKIAPGMKQRLEVLFRRYL